MDEKPKAAAPKVCKDSGEKLVKDVPGFDGNSRVWDDLILFGVPGSFIRCATNPWDLYVYWHLHWHLPLKKTKFCSKAKISQVLKNML